MMPVDFPDVSVVIVSYNTRELLLQCLQALFEESPNLELEVIVVDNDSADGSCEAVREHFPGVRLIANRENVGISRANNQGMRAGRGRYVLLLNPDTAVLDRAVERMVAFMDDHPEVGACGSKLLYPDGTPQASTALPLPRLTGALYNYSALFERFPRLGGTLAREWTERVDETRPVGYCSTACLLVSRTCVEEVGMMDEDFFLYGDDVDWCKQMWEGGWPVFYLPEARVVHYEGAATGSLAPRRWRELQGTLQYLRKWHGEAYARSYRAVVWLCSLYRYGKIRLRELRGAADEEGLGAYCAFYRAVLTGEFEQAPAHGGQGG